MKIEQSYKNYLPLKIKLVASIITFIFALSIGIFEYYQLVFITPTNAKIISIDWNTTPYSGYKIINVIFENSESTTTLSGYKLPFYYKTGDTIQVYHSPMFGNMIYDQIGMFIVTPLLIVGSFISVNKFLKKNIVEI